jgi:ATP-dependent RNA helicase SUPV3L1/SUV3
MAAPVQVRDPGFAEIIKELAACIASKTTNGHILDLKTFDLELLEKDIHDHRNGVKGFLRSAEALHKAITLYMWLSYRFAGMFTSHKLALHLKTLTEQKIEQCLSVFEYDASAIKARTFLRKQQLAKQMEEISRRKSELDMARDGPSKDYGLADLERVTEESDELEEAIDLGNVVEHESSITNTPQRQRIDVE